MEAHVNDLMECCQGHLTRLFNVKLSPLDFTNSIHSGKGLAAGDKVSRNPTKGSVPCPGTT